jgi:hypothetical protein
MNREILGKPKRRLKRYSKDGPKDGPKDNRQDLLNEKHIAATY